MPGKEAVIDALAALLGGKDRVEEPVGEANEKAEEPKE